MRRREHVVVRISYPDAFDLLTVTGLAGADTFAIGAGGESLITLLLVQD